MQFTDSAKNKSNQAFANIESRHQPTELVHGLAAAIYTCDADGYIKFFNKAAADLWGREPEIGKDLWCGSWKIYEQDGITPLALDSCPMAIALKEGRTVRGREIIVERPDGLRRNVMPYPDPIFDNTGRVVEAVNMLVDITDLKQKERALRESQEQLQQIAAELEQRVEARTSDLKTANVELLRINGELEQFAFVASHDMQEPLRKIKTFAQRLETHAGKSLDEVAISYLDKIKGSSVRMSRLINDILNYSRLAYLEEQFEPTDLNLVLKNVINDFELSIEEKNAVIQTGALPVVNAIPLQMVQLFHNIISNSLKFCMQDCSCEVVISSRILPKEAIAVRGLNAKLSYCEILFKDNGMGFDQQYAESIFKIFQRLNTKRKHEGTGIGLALCRKIVGIHKGDISAQSVINQGTVIHVILPV